MEKKNETMLTTRDGETVPAATALALNYQAVLNWKLAVKQSLQHVFQQLLNDITKNPATHCVSSQETQYAKQLEELLSKASRTMKPAAHQLWVPYSEALANWEKHQTKPATSKALKAEDAKTAAVEAAVKRANEKLGREIQAAKEADEAAKQLLALSPAAAEAEAKKAQSRAKQVEVETKLLPYALGKAFVDANEGPRRLIQSATNSVKVTYPRDMASAIKEGSDPTGMTAVCSFCGAEHTLGDNYFFVLNRNGENKSITVFKAQLLWLPVRNKEGTEEYRNRSGRYEGLLKKLPVLACNECARLARKMAEAEGVVKDALPNSGSVLEPVLAAVLKTKQEREDERKTASHLSVTWRESENAKSSRRDNHKGRREDRQGKRGRFNPNALRDDE
jgi:hypothetical protein